MSWQSYSSFISCIMKGALNNPVSTEDIKLIYSKITFNYLVRVGREGGY